MVNYGILLRTSRVRSSRCGAELRKSKTSRITQSRIALALCRLFVDAVLYVARTGIPWRDLPERFGNWNSAWRRFDRWAAKGVWARVMDALGDPDLEWLILDSTVIRAHPCAAGSKKSGTALGAKASRRWDVAAAASAPRST